jgi:hypothetical protein
MLFKGIILWNFFYKIAITTSPIMSTISSATRMVDAELAPPSAVPPSTSNEMKK